MKMPTSRILGALRRSLFTLTALLPGALMAQTPPAAKPNPIAIAVHGGAGVIERETMSPESEAAYRAALELALRTGHKVLSDGGSSLDAVTAAVKVMEDSPLFNAGKGSVFTLDGRNELDASIMEGRTLRAGAVSGLARVKNPIELARAVMERTSHVMLSGAGAEEFALSIGMPLVDPSYFHTPERWEQLQKLKAALAADPKLTLSSDAPGLLDLPEVPRVDSKFGTVGAVAVDRRGDLAAATSTGGMTGKRWGRIGDTPLIGAGTFADNASVAVSGTGHGEFFIRNAVAHDVAALVAYRGLPVRAAAEEVVLRKLVQRGGEGGVIAIDRKGNIAQPFNSKGMYRGAIGVDGKLTTAIFRD
jgi:beta-aspartyl-peptidase (threonine type)